MLVRKPLCFALTAAILYAAYALYGRATPEATTAAQAHPTRAAAHTSSVQQHTAVTAPTLPAVALVAPARVPDPHHAHPIDTAAPLQTSTAAEFAAEHAARSQAVLPGAASAPAKDAQLLLAELTMALQDRDPRARYRALAQSYEHALPLPEYLLAHLASRDPDRDVRLLALTAYAQSAADSSIVRASAEVGLKDADPVIRARAKEILEQLDLAVRANDDTPQLPPGEALVQ